MLRAVAVGLDGPGEPGYITGYALEVGTDGAATAEVFTPFA